MSNFRLISAVIAQHSLPYSKIDNTQATYAALFAGIEMCFDLKTSASDPNADDAAAMRPSTSPPCPGSRCAESEVFFERTPLGLCELGTSTYNLGHEWAKSDLSKKLPGASLGYILRNRPTGMLLRPY